MGLPIVDNQNLGRCGPCGGECCKRMPGYAAPEDTPDLAELGRLVLSGRWTFDQWDGDPHEETDEVPGLDDLPIPRVLLPRPAIKGHEGKPRHATWGGGTCTLHGPAGCLLTFERRPVQCRALVPGTQGKDCKGGPSKLDLALAWRPRAADLEEVLAWVLRERGEAPAARLVTVAVGETECGPYSHQRIMTSPIA